jgi:hypothetical protein
MVCLQSSSSQVASADVLGQQILSSSREPKPVSLHGVRNLTRLLTLLFGVSVNAALSEAAPVALSWPDGYVVHEVTVSPDGRYGVLVPTGEAWENNESLSEKNYLGDVKNHRVLGTIGKVDYFEHQNHRGLVAFWAPDSKICVVENDGRYGPESISVLDINDSSFAQTEVGDRIQKALEPR